MSYPAVVLSKARGAVLQQNPQKPYPPTPGPDEVLIRNVAVASNPKDWKLSKVGVFEGIEGNDVAGYVEAVGANVKEFKKGDRVGAFTKMATNNTYGAYQTHSVSPSWTTFQLGPNTSFESAATLPLAVMTAAIGLFRKIGLVEPTPDGKPNPKAQGQAVLVWGASSSVGAYAVQLAHLAGYKVIGIAGAGADLAKSLGATFVVDYRSPDVRGAIKSAIASVGLPLVGAFDAHADKSGSTASYTELAQALQPRGGIVTVVLNVPKKAAAELPKSVQVPWTGVGSAHLQGPKGDAEFARRWFHQLAKWVDQGIFKPNVVKVVPGGLAGVREGLGLMEAGKVSGVKLVYRIDETPKGKL
ncbi:NAD(P)-binding protein [Gonapodya prolifera JEL478]|uniref:NAD(P)-binding protein n=1 Tax=Gonapodya prolifera (strain JEL478) TaxID=1344416 RepID=A0A139ABL8_GONPJ|nr:NAD(P)-binding protein [Gonapodya prolifera JEL478]|eukprot:KXS14069.1 NAD(P)-binding protein [Gonapodya prolifera JEL478]